MADLQRRDAALAAVARLERGDHAAAVVAQRAQPGRARGRRLGATKPPSRARSGGSSTEAAGEPVARGRRAQRRGGASVPASRRAARRGQRPARSRSARCQAVARGQRGRAGRRGRAPGGRARAPCRAARAAPRAASRAALGARQDQLDRVEPGVDGGGVEQRARPAARPAGGRRRRSPCGRWRPAASPRGRRPGCCVDLQAGAGGGSTGHDVGLAGAARRARAPAACRPGWLQVVERSAPSAATSARAKRAEAVERARRRRAASAAPPRPRAVEAPAGSGLHDRPPARLQRRAAPRRRTAGRATRISRRAPGAASAAARPRGAQPWHSTSPVESSTLARPPRRRPRTATAPGSWRRARRAAPSSVSVPGVTTRTTSRRTTRLGAALPGLGRVLHLLADGDLEALADQLGEVGLGGVHRHAAHRDVARRRAGRAR